jgi:hypothetical protein
MKQQLDESIGKLKSLNDAVYKNRPVDLQTVPELAMNLAAPGDEKFADSDEKTQRDKYSYRVLHFRSQNIVKQANALIADMQLEQSSVEAALAKTAEGRDFMGPK